MTRVVQLTDVFTDTTLPRLLGDPILTNGSLQLYEPANPAYPWASGVPIDGYVMPNLAWQYAVTAGLGTTEAQTEGKFRVPTNNTSSLFKSERTAKGGIHGISTQSAWVATSGNQPTFGMVAEFPDSIIAYLAANPAHSYFFSVWGIETRGHAVANPGNMDNFAHISRFTGSATVGAFAMFDNHSAYTGNQLMTLAGSRGQPSAADVPVGQFIMNMGGVPTDTGSNFTNTNYVIQDTNATGTMASPTRQAAQWGQTSWAANTALHNNAKSWVWYRTYMEDLTVSGRSYATVDGIDNTAYTAQVLTAGGRYYGDTYTAPSTLP